MPSVIIRYGPYSVYGVIRHRNQKIYGLVAQLDSLGYECELVEINEYNRLTIEMCQREIFRCDIRNLLFNVPCEDDVVCQRAVKMVEEANNRMRNIHRINTQQDVYIDVRKSAETTIDEARSSKELFERTSDVTSGLHQNQRISKVKIVESKKEQLSFRK